MNIKFVYILLIKSEYMVIHLNKKFDFSSNFEIKNFMTRMFILNNCKVDDLYILIQCHKKNGKRYLQRLLESTTSITIR